MVTNTDSKVQERKGDSCIVVIFGASGDLTKRKLIPALYNLRIYNLLPKDFAVIGVARRELTDEAFRAQISGDVHQFATQKVDDAIWKEFESRIYFSKGDFDNPETFNNLGKLAADVAKKHNIGGNILFYLATPPSEFVTVINELGASGLATQENGFWRRVIVEKPFGHDLESARALNKDIRRVLSESQIYRIDHYLGKETVQNILVFRFGNGIFEPVWNRRYIDHVQITVAEQVGVEGRGAYYEEAGVLRDMMQNHMFMLMALVAMEPPSSIKGDAVRNEKVKVLESIRPMCPEEVIQRTVRGQYGAGIIGDKSLPAYRSEPKGSPNSQTETYAAMKLDIDNWRWAGVPFYLRSGKRLKTRCTEIMIQFRRAPLLLFGEMLADPIGPNRLILHIQPEEGITLQIRAKTPGPTLKTQGIRLDFNYKDFGEAMAGTGYERLLYDCMIGDSTLFHRTDMVEAAWKIATPILDVWKTLPPREFPNYDSGSWGPAAADHLIGRDGNTWRNPDA